MKPPADPFEHQSPIDAVLPTSREREYLRRVAVQERRIEATCRLLRQGTTR
jgi:hypothetical protein